MKVAWDVAKYYDKAVKREKYGVLRELNSGPPAPKAGIIPLDQVPGDVSTSTAETLVSRPMADVPTVSRTCIFLQYI